MMTVPVTIRGISPLLMHRYPMEAVEALEKKPPKEQATLALYEREGRPFIPGINLQRCLIAAAAFSKGKGRASLQKNVCAGLFIDEPELPLNGATSAWMVDARPVVIPATKGRIVRYRPRFDEWEVRFTLSYDETLLSGSQVRRIVDDGGQRVGLLDFRPEKKGSFGRFMVTHWGAAI